MGVSCLHVDHEHHRSGQQREFPAAFPGRSTPKPGLAGCLQGEKLSSAALITLVQIGMYFVLGIGIPAEVYQLALFLPNSRCAPASLRRKPGCYGTSEGWRQQNVAHRHTKTHKPSGHQAPFKTLIQDVNPPGSSLMGVLGNERERLCVQEAGE